MSVSPDQFAHLEGLVDRAGMADKQVVVVGVGAVGSQVAKELAGYATGRFLLIDHDDFTLANSSRHALPVEYAEGPMPWNKAEGMAVYLKRQIRGLHVQAIRRKVDSSVLDNELDLWLADADLILAATDERDAQRRIGRRALALDIPAVFPGLYEGHGGEVFIQRSPRHPCYFCWDGWRPADQAVRGAAAGNADILDIIALTTKLCVGILDQTSDHVRRFLVVGPGESQPPQLFVTNDHTTARRPVTRRPDCPSCEVGPSPLKPEAREAWEAAQRARAEAQPRPQTAILHPAALPSISRRAVSPIDWDEAVPSGFGVILWYCISAEGWAGFRLWWNPIGLIPLIWWFIYFFVIRE